MILGIFLITLVYFAIGLFVLGFYAIGHDLDFPFCGYNTPEEDNKSILIWTFWPIFFVYIVIKGIIWYAKHLYIAIKSVIDQNIKFN